jgi:hypothetical protein
MQRYVRALAFGRIAVGALMLWKPEQAVQGWIGGVASRSGTQTITRAFGARDLVLGAGTLAALGRGDAKDWVAAGGFSDVVDLVATMTAEDVPMSGRILVGAMAGGAIAVSAAWLASGSEAST